MTQSTSRCLSARSISHLCRPARIAAITTRSVRPSVRQWPSPPVPHRGYSTSDDGDPRLRELGRRIQDDYAYIRDNYGEPLCPPLPPQNMRVPPLLLLTQPQPPRSTPSFWHMASWALPS